MLRDPDGPLKIPPAYLPAITPWLWRFWRSSYGAAYEHGVKTLTAFNRGVVEDAEALFARAGIPHMIKRDPALYLYESEASYRSAAGHWRTRSKAGLQVDARHRRPRSARWSRPSRRSSPTA